MRQKEIQHARYVLSRQFGEYNVRLMSESEIVKQMRENPQLRLYDKYLSVKSKRFKLTKGSPQRTEAAAQFYANNLKEHGFFTYITPAKDHLKSSIPLERGWLIYARDTQKGDMVNVQCTSCHHDTIALKSQLDKDGYVTKGLTLGCSQCGGNLKRYRPWW